MSKTSCRIEFGLYDVTAKDDASIAVSTRQPFSGEAGIITKEPLEVPLYATLEPNQSFLDGSFMEFPDSPQGMGWWSLTTSDSSGVFASPPIATFTFSGSHSSNGLTVRSYYGEWASEIYALWYDASDVVIGAGYFYPDSNEYFIKSTVENYRKIVLEFRGTNIPQRFLKITGIDFGEMKILTGNDLIEAKIYEEIDPLSATVSVNTLNFKLYSNDPEFSILKQDGVFSLLQQRQKFQVWQTVDGAIINMGAYYLDEWENVSDTVMQLKAIDLIGIAGQTDFDGGMYSGIMLESLISEICAGTEIVFEIANELKNIPIHGHIPICTRREALQQAAFAVGAIVDTQRLDKLQIFRPPVEASALIAYTRKFTGGTIKLNALISGVSVVSHNYSVNTEAKNIFKDELPAGTYDILFSEPVYSITSSNATVLSSNVNKARIAVPSAREVVIDGMVYEESTNIVSKNIPDLLESTAPNVLKIESATLVGQSNADFIVENALSRYQGRHASEFRSIITSEKVGQMVIAENAGGQAVKGIITSISPDLTGGFISTIKIVGTLVARVPYYYAGEIYAGENMGVM